MPEFFSSGHAIDLVLIVLGLETVGFYILWRWRGCGISPLTQLLIVATGGALLLAARAALTGAGWYWVGFFLIAALAAHLTDLRLRWTSCERKRL